MKIKTNRIVIKHSDFSILLRKGLSSRYIDELNNLFSGAIVSTYKQESEIHTVTMKDNKIEVFTNSSREYLNYCKKSEFWLNKWLKNIIKFLNKKR